VSCQYVRSREDGLVRERKGHRFTPPPAGGHGSNGVTEL
jgi:hypothetical protein